MSQFSLSVNSRNLRGAIFFYARNSIHRAQLNFEGAMQVVGISEISHAGDLMRTTTESDRSSREHRSTARSIFAMDDDVFRRSFAISRGRAIRYLRHDTRSSMRSLVLRKKATLRGTADLPLPRTLRCFAFILALNTCRPPHLSWPLIPSKMRVPRSQGGGNLARGSRWSLAHDSSSPAGAAHKRASVIKRVRDTQWPDARWISSESDAILKWTSGLGKITQWTPTNGNITSTLLPLTRRCRCNITHVLYCVHTVKWEIITLWRNVIVSWCLPGMTHNKHVDCQIWVIS